MYDWVIFGSKTKFHETLGRSEKEVMREQGLWTEAGCLGRGEDGGGSVGLEHADPGVSLVAPGEAAQPSQSGCMGGQLRDQHGNPGLQDFTVATDGRVLALSVHSPSVT